LIKILFGVGEAPLAGALRAQAVELTDVEVIGIEDTAADVVAAVGTNPSLDVVLVHEGLGIDLIRDLVLRHPQLAVVLIADEATADIFTSAMAAGARALVSRDPTLAELQSRINGAAEWTRAMRAHFNSSSANPISTEVGTLLAVCGAKGGTGTTTLAIQLALAATAAKRRVCLIDMDLQNGDIPTFMDISHRRSIVDLAAAADDLDGTALAEALFIHPAGPHVLLAPTEGERAEDLTSRAARQIIGAIRARYDLVIVDCGAFMTEGNAMAVEQADTVLVTATPDIPSLRAVKRLARLWSRLQIRKEEDVSVVLVKQARRNEIQPDFARRVLGMKLLRAMVPAVYRSLEEAGNTGSPTSVDNGEFKKSVGAIARETGILDDATVRAGGRDRGAAMPEFMGVLPFVGIVVLLIWQVILIGLTSMYASHAANEGARAAAVLGTGPQDQAEIRKRAVARISGAWSDREHLTITTTGGYVRVTIDTPAVFPGFQTSIGITAESKIVPEEGLR
jgi:pilus assembly protein CpaE